jgi:hypothetical protein
MLQQDRPVAAYVDLHNHSKAFNAFIYGCDPGAGGGGCVCAWAVEGGVQARGLGDVVMAAICTRIPEKSGADNQMPRHAPPPPLARPPSGRASWRQHHHHRRHHRHLRRHARRPRPFIAARACGCCRCGCPRRTPTSASPSAPSRSRRGRRPPPGGCVREMGRCGWLGELGGPGVHWLCVSLKPCIQLPTFHLPQRTRPCHTQSHHTHQPNPPHINHQRSGRLSRVGHRAVLHPRGQLPRPEHGAAGWPPLPHR